MLVFLEESKVVHTHFFLSFYLFLNENLKFKLNCYVNDKALKSQVFKAKKESHFPNQIQIIPLQLIK